MDVSSEAELLDTAGGLGWDLASQMLMPREHVTSGYRDAFSLQDVLDPPRTRVSVQGALAHPFLSSSLSRELEEAMEAVSKRGRGKEGGVLEGLVDKVNDLYARISKVGRGTVFSMSELPVVVPFHHPPFAVDP